ncbi:TIGR01777 family oxidoreductase [uncultured Chloroflexus sp.]|uniref:TIGR01777 family oxidoreductase n=1 Tax=uncultured Chloroflexus sp. TaxID=214040 RepID=UPI00263755A9|nr:TIGR01777 family oxidoreductase [uncultured Chloroflexus sp.]
MSTKRIVITGATGLIGRKLVAELRNDYELVIFSRDPARARSALPGAAEYVAWQPAEQGPWFANINGAWGVIHLAGAPISSGLLGMRWTPQYKAEILNSRVIGTRGIVNAMAAAQQRPTVFVSASAVGYYGFYRDSTPLDESAPAGRDFLAQVCVAWEAEAAKAEALGVRTVMIRTGLVLDPNSGALPQIMLPFKLLIGGPILPGTQVYPWIHPADEVGLIRFALENERVRGPLNAAAPNALANRDFAAVLGKVLGSPSWLPVPEFSLRLALGEMADLVVNGQNAVPRKALDLGYQFQFPTLEPALRDLLNIPH